MILLYFIISLFAQPSSAVAESRAVFELMAKGENKVAHCSSSLVKHESSCRLITNAHCTEEKGIPFTAYFIQNNKKSIQVKIKSINKVLDLAEIERPAEIGCEGAVQLSNANFFATSGLQAVGFIDGKLVQALPNNDPYSATDIVPTIYENSNKAFVAKIFMRQGMSGGLLLKSNGDALGILEKFKPLQQGAQIILKDDIELFLNGAASTKAARLMDEGDEIANGGDFDSILDFSSEDALIAYLFPRTGLKSLDKKGIEKFFGEYEIDDTYLGSKQWHPWNGPVFAKLNKSSTDSTTQFDFAEISYPFTGVKIRSNSIEFEFLPSETFKNGTQLNNALLESSRINLTKLEFTISMEKSGKIISPKQTKMSCSVNNKKGLSCGDGQKHWLTISPYKIKRFFVYRILIKNEDGTFLFSNGLVSRTP